MIVFAILGAVICAKARVPAGAVVFSLVGIVLFISTPMGQGVPEAVASFVSRLNDTTTPVLTETAPEAGSGAVG
nr:hypothetical protein [Pseudonocardia acidicola]